MSGKTMFGLPFALFAIFIAQSGAFDIQPKIINGTISASEEIPFFVALSYDNRPVCSASLLSDRWIITAGHCLERNIPLQVSLGIRPDNAYEQTVDVDVSDQHIHPEYFYDRKNCDIGLIEIPHPIQLSQTIRPTKLSQTCGDINRSEAVCAIGRGASAVGTNTDGIVRHGIFEEVSCDSDYLLVTYDILDSSVICSKSTNGQNTGSGDSGGPMLRMTDGSQHGIVRGHLWEFQQFTKISYFFDWIAHKTGLELPKCDRQAPY